MTDLTPNIPDVVAEISALFEAYEQALIDKNVDVLDAAFWNSPHTIRYALHENGYGFKEIHGHRVALLHLHVALFADRPVHRHLPLR